VWRNRSLFVCTWIYAKLCLQSSGGTLGSLSPVFVHQYGWDEALLFVVPIVIAVVVVRRLDKKSRRQDKPPSEEGEDSRHEN
jgi:hypothetical protein